MRVRAGIKYVGASTVSLDIPSCAYAPDHNELDQGAVGNGRSIKAYVDKIGTTDKGTILLTNKAGQASTTYTLTTSDTITSNITFIMEPGAIIDGTGTLTINGPFEASLSQCFGASITISGLNIAYPEWWGENTTLGTTDMTTAIQAALDSGCLRVNLIDTTYLISATLDVPTGVNFAGAGFSSIIKAAADFGDNPLIRNKTITPANDAARDSNIIIENLQIDGNRANNSTGTEFSHGVSFRAVVYSTVRNCKIVSPKGDGIYISLYTTGPRICEDVHVENNKIYDVYRNGIALVAGNRVDISHNIIDTTASAYGIDIEPGASGRITKNITISNNIINAPTKAGISLDAHLIDAADQEQWNVIGNTIISPSNATYGHGIHVQGVRCLTNITGNNIFDAGKYGIYLDASVVVPNGINLTGNVIKNADDVGYYGAGDKCSFVGNTVYADAAHAITINTADDNIVMGNYVYQTLNTAYGINIINAHSRCVVVGNNLYGGGIANASKGIYDAVGTNDLIVGNIVFNFQYGIQLAVTCPESTIVANNQANGCAAGTEINDLRTVIAAGTLEPEGFSSFNSTAGAMAVTLPDGDYIGQRHTCVLTTDGGNVTLTVTHHHDGDAGTYTFDDVDEAVMLEWMGTEWTEIATSGGIAAYAP